MINEKVNASETVTVQLIKGVAPVIIDGEITDSGCGIPSITFERVVQEVSTEEK